jgi:hypothetical protein
MKARRAPARGIAALLLLCLLLAGAVALEIRHPDALVLRAGLPQGGTLIVPGGGADGGPEPGRYQPPGEADFTVIENRPLFAPDRRPTDSESPAGADAPVTPAALDGVALTGIIGAGADRVAIVEPKGPPRPGVEALSLRVGDELRGWTLEAIEDDRILLVTKTQKFYMEMVDDPARRRGTRKRRPPAQPGGAVRTPGRLAPQPAPQSQPQSQLQPQPQLQLQPQQQ